VLLVSFTSCFVRVHVSLFFVVVSLGVAVVHAPSPPLSFLSSSQ
jgi:hypothetical protein